MEFDILIKGAKIIDGTGSPWYKGDIGVIGDKIKKIGNLKNSIGKHNINATGKVVCPGFIDAHTHFDLVPFEFGEFRDPLLKMRLYQGITTQIAGCCGNSMAPVTKKNKQEWLAQRTSRTIRRYNEANWLIFKEFFKELKKQSLGTNYAYYVGHSTLRFNVLGFSSNKADKNNIRKMKKLLRQSIEEGAIGLSTGLAYSPGIFSDTDELVELCSVLSDYNAIYASHIRNDTDKFLDAVKEVIKIAEINGIPGQIHHVKIRKRNSSKEIIEEFFKIIYEARKRGVDITMELYPYNASWLGIDALMLPSWAREGGNKKILGRLNDKILISKMKQDICKLRNWTTERDIIEDSKNIIIVAPPTSKEFIGKSLFGISKLMGNTPFEAAIEIIKMTSTEASAVYISLKEEDIIQFLKCPFTIIGSDAVPTRLGWSAHPRNNGTFPRILGKYVRDDGVISLEEAIHKMTGLSATRFRFDDRGLLKEGLKADIVIFNESKIIDTATYLEPFNKPKGIEYVIVNGCISIEKGEFTGKVNGKVLKRK
jgi:N-acyl-D-amino-acid deacylase